MLMSSQISDLGEVASEETYMEPGMLLLCGINGRSILGFLAAVKGGVEGYLIEELGFGRTEVERVKRVLRRE
jgi:hypothetical protein